MAIERYRNTEYFGGVKLGDFQRLIKIENPHQVTSQSVYLVFNSDNIKNYDKAEDSIKKQFHQLRSENTLTFVRSKGAAGVKNLCHSEVQVSGKINDKKFLAKIDYELKIPKCRDRIGLYTLKPLSGQGPVILVAALYVEEGFKKEKNKKLAKHVHQLPALTLSKGKNPQHALARQGFFKANLSHRGAVPSLAMSHAIKLKA